MRRSKIQSSAHRAVRLTRGGFTLIEILVVIAILGTLVALLLPAARGTIASARGFKCQMAQRAIAFDFSTFADDTLHPSRGDDESIPGRSAFRLETFIEYEYGIDEFWAWPGENTHPLPDDKGNDPLRCVEVRGPLTAHAGMPCSSGEAIQPPQNVSYGFNIRLHISERQRQATNSAWVTLTDRILDGYGLASPDTIPLAWDVNGARAAQVGSNPLFSGPSLLSTSLYANNRYWYPSLRHNKGLNVAFVDGHVEATRAPLDQRNWAWGFEPVR